MTGEEIYPPRRLSLVLRILVGVGALALITWVLSFAPNTGHANIFNLAILAGCGALIAWATVGFALQLFDPSGLTLSDSGFSFRGVWRRQYITWREVSAFRVVHYRTIVVIGFDVANAPESAWRRMNRRAMGVSDFIFSHSFTGPEQPMCDRLNAHRLRAIGHTT